MFNKFTKRLLQLGKISADKMPGLFRIPKAYMAEKPLPNLSFLDKIKAGEVGLVGHYNPSSGYELRKGIRETERHLREIPDKEHAVLWARSGNIYHNIGSSYNVSIADITPKDELRAAIMTHNHPKETVQKIERVGFSGSDIQEYYDKRLALLRGVDSQHTFSMHNPNKKLRKPLPERYNVRKEFEDDMHTRITGEYYWKTGKILEEQEAWDMINDHYANLFGHKWWRRLK